MAAGADASTGSGIARPLVFVRRGLFSNTNLSVARMLTDVFPEHPLRVLDVWDDGLARRPAWRALNWGATAVRYGGRMALRRAAPGDCFLRTILVGRLIRRWVRQTLAEGPAPVLTFQTSSLFGADVPGVPHVIYTDHTHLTNLYYPGFDRRKLFHRRWLEEERNWYHRADLVLTMSDHVRRSLHEHYAVSPERTGCILAGSNTVVGPQADQPRPWDAQRILFLGVDWKRKGGPQLLEAFQQVRRQFPKAKLIIVGCCPAVADDGVEVVGRVPLAEVGKHLAGTSIFCLPTLAEPFGIAFLEAAEYGLPAVGTDLGAVPQMIIDGQTGRLVAPGAVSPLVAALGELLADPGKAQQWGEAGRRHVRAEFTWAAVGHRLRREVDRVWDNRKKRRCLAPGDAASSF